MTTIDCRESDEVWADGLNAELAQLSRDEDAHLEKEFEDYKRLLQIELDRQDVESD